MNSDSGFRYRILGNIFDSINHFQNHHIDNTIDISKNDEFNFRKPSIHSFEDGFIATYQTNNRIFGKRYNTQHNNGVLFEINSKNDLSDIQSNSNTFEVKDGSFIVFFGAFVDEKKNKSIFLQINTTKISN